MGIGIDSPSHRLNVFSGAEDIARFQGAGSYNLDLSNPGNTRFDFKIGSAAGEYSFTNSSSELMRIDSSGNVGIGTTSPTRKLWVEQTDGVNNINGVFKTNSPVDSVIAFSDGTSTNGDFGVRCGSHGDNFSIFTNGANERLTVDETGNVGIGNSDPARDLTIGGATADTTHLQLTNATTGVTTGDGFHISQYTSGAVQLWNKENSYMAFGTNNTERMRIDSDGNVGIGTNGDATDKLDVKAAGDDERLVRISHPSSPTAAAGYFGFTDTGSGANTGVALGVQYAGDYYDAITIDRETRNVGIGTSTFNWSAGGRTTLEVDGSTSALIGLKNNDTRRGYLAASATGTELYSDAAPLLFSVGSEAMRIDASGNLLVGKTAGAFGLGAQIHPNGPSTFMAPSNAPSLYLGRASSDAAFTIAAFYGGSSYATAAGGITAKTSAAPAFFSSSDERLKDNITDHESELANVMALRPT